MRNQLSSYENFFKLIKLYWKFSGAQLRSRHERTSGARSCATLPASLSRPPGVSASPSRVNESERVRERDLFCRRDHSDDSDNQIDQWSNREVLRVSAFPELTSDSFYRGIVHIGKSSDFIIWKKWKNQSICLYVSLVEIIISFLSSNNNTNKMYISRTGKRLRRMSVSLVKKNYLSETSVCDSANSLLSYTSC